MISVMMLFQSTLPRGSDPVRLEKSKARLYFNPRSLAGATLSDYDIFSTPLISIHAPSRERPKYIMDRSHYNYISIHAPSRERLPTIKRLCIGRTISIHAPSRERLESLSKLINSDYFNPRSLAGATMSRRNIGYASQKFQSTLPRGSDNELFVLQARSECISIHAPSRERPS